MHNFELNLISVSCLYSKSASQPDGTIL